MPQSNSQSLSSPSYVYWLTGLSGSGKTTAAHLLQQYFKQHNKPCVLIDGDVIRLIFGQQHYDQSSRLEAAYHYSKLAFFLVSEHVNVICATISLFHEIQHWNRQHLSSYYEILVKRDLEQLMKEDPKNIYQQALKMPNPQVWGIDLVPEYPKNPDLILDNVPQDQLPTYIKNIFHHTQKL